MASVSQPARQGCPRDFSGTFSSVTGTSEGLSAVQKGKPVTELKDANHLVRAGSSALDNVHREPAPRGLLVLDLHEAGEYSGDPARPPGARVVLSLLAPMPRSRRRLGGRETAPEA